MRALFAVRCLILSGFLSGCASQQQPMYITGELPDIPQHCDVTQKPTPAEPKLPNQDISDIDAAKDRLRLKQAYRTAKAYRSACYEELRAVLKQKPKPTS